MVLGIPYSSALRSIQSSGRLGVPFISAFHTRYPSVHVQYRFSKTRVFYFSIQFSIPYKCSISIPYTLIILYTSVFNSHQFCVHVSILNIRGFFPPQFSIVTTSEFRILGCSVYLFITAQFSIHVSILCTLSSRTVLRRHQCQFCVLFQLERILVYT